MSRLAVDADADEIIIFITSAVCAVCCLPFFLSVFLLSFSLLLFTVESSSISTVSPVFVSESTFDLGVLSVRSM
jgi:hypothetical protein